MVRDKALVAHRSLWYLRKTMTTASVLDRLLDPLGQSLTPEVARALLAVRADEDTQARIDELADKCTEGTLTDAERTEYEAYVAAIDLVGVLQAKARRTESSTMGLLAHGRSW